MVNTIRFRLNNHNLIFFCVNSLAFYGGEQRLEEFPLQRLGESTPTNTKLQFFFNHSKMEPYIPYLLLCDLFSRNLETFFQSYNWTLQSYSTPTKFYRIWLCLQLSNWFRAKLNSVWFEINKLDQLDLLYCYTIIPTDNTTIYKSITRCIEGPNTLNRLLITQQINEHTRA